MNLNFAYGWGAFGLVVSVGLAILTYVIYYFIIKTAVNRSNITAEIYALRNDLNELERRQADRFIVLDAHLQEQNALLREQNEWMHKEKR